MFKRYYNSSDERELKMQATYMFREVSSGVYHVEKDRTDTFKDSEFVKSSTVVNMLNSYPKVAVTGSSGIYANFEKVTYTR
jgi:hypothetical protein